MKPIERCIPSSEALRCRYCLNVAGGALWRCIHPDNQATAEVGEPCLRGDWQMCKLNPDVPAWYQCPSVWQTSTSEWQTSNTVLQSLPVVTGSDGDGD